MSDNQLSGRELDAAVAEHVFGWQRMSGATALAPYAYKRPDGHVVHPYSAPNYSESIGAAMEVVTNLDEKGCSVAMSSGDTRTDKEWFVEFMTGDQQFLYTGAGASDCLPEAICLAALDIVADLEQTQK